MIKCNVRVELCAKTQIQHCSNYSVNLDIKYQKDDRRRPELWTARFIPSNKKAEGYKEPSSKKTADTSLDPTDVRKEFDDPQRHLSYIGCGLRRKSAWEDSSQVIS